MFMDRKTQYYYKDVSSQLYLQVECNRNKNSSKLLCG